MPLTLLEDKTQNKKSGFTILEDKTLPNTKKQEYIPQDFNPVIKASLISEGVYDNKQDELSNIYAEVKAKENYNTYVSTEDIDVRNSIASKAKKDISSYYDNKINQIKAPATSINSVTGVQYTNTQDPLKEKQLNVEKLNSLSAIDRETAQLNVATSLPELKPDFDPVNETEESIIDNALRIYTIQQYPTNTDMQNRQYLRGLLNNDANVKAYMQAQESGINPDAIAMNSDEYSKAIYTGVSTKIDVVKKQQEFLEKEIQNENKKKEDIVLKIKEFDELVKKQPELKTYSTNPEYYQELQDRLKQQDDLLKSLQTKKYNFLTHEVKLQQVLEDKGKIYKDYKKLSEERDVAFDLTEYNISSAGLNPVQAIFDRFTKQSYDWAVKTLSNASNITADLIEPSTKEQKNFDYLNDEGRKLFTNKLLGLPEEGYASKSEFLESKPVFDKEGNLKDFKWKFNWYNLPFQTAKVGAESYLLGGGGALGTRAFESLNALNKLKYAESFLGRVSYGALKQVSTGTGMLLPSYMLFGQEMFENEMRKTGDYEFSKKIALLRVGIETASELINPLEINQFLDPNKFLADLTTEQAEKLSVKMFGDSKWGKALEYLSHPSKFSKTWLKEGGKEYLEEFGSNFGNWALDKAISAKDSGYSQDNEMSVENEVLTAINTIASMGLLAGSETIRSHKNAINSSQFIVGRTPELFAQRVNDELKKGKITQAIADKRLAAIKKSEEIYNFSKIDVTPISDKAQEAISSFDNLKPAQKEALKKEVEAYSENMNFTIFLNNKKILENSERIPALLNKINLLSQEKAPKEVKELDDLREEMLKLSLENKSISNNAVSYIDYIQKVYGGKIREANNLAELNPEVEQAPETIELEGAEEGQVAEGGVTTFTPESLKDKESTNKALEDKRDGSNLLDITKLITIQQHFEIANRIIGDRKSIPLSEIISEAYHADKEAGKETALTKAVEELLGKEVKKPTTIQKSPFEQTKEKISSFSKDELSNYNPFIDKTLSKEEKKELNSLKLQRLQELENTENTISFGDKTFKKGEQVTTDQGKTYWYVDSVTEDGKLKLQRKFENTTETTTISDPNDVISYTPQEEKITKEPQEALDEVFGKPEPTEDIEAKKADIERRKPEKGDYQYSNNGKNLERTDLFIDDKKAGTLTIVKNQEGYSIQNILLDDEFTRKGYGKQIYIKLNTESLKETSNPLKSSSFEDMNKDSIKLWDKFVNEGIAIKDENNYRFKYDAELAALESKKDEINIITTSVDEIVSELNKLATFQEKLEWLRKNNLLEPIKINGKNYNVIDYHDRVMVFMKIGKYNIPFYISTGQAGKKNVKSGNWYVVFGIGEERGWINKGSEKDINNQYNFPVFQKLAKILNEGIGTIESRENNGNGKLKDGIGFLEHDSKNPKEIREFNSQMNLPTEPAGRADASDVFYKHVNNTLNLINEEIISLQKNKKEQKLQETANQVTENVLTEVVETTAKSEVSEIKPQEPEKAKKQQDKEIVEKFQAPVTPFKNGKVKTSNWNEAIEKIKTNVSNYRVKVVNVKNIPFEDLPPHTQKTFEIDAKKEKKSIEEVQKGNNWKFLQVVDNTGKPLLVNDKPVYANFPDGTLLDYRDDKYYDEKLDLLKQSVKGNPTLTIERISNYPVEITQDTNELSVAIGKNDFSITKGSKGFPVAKVGEQEINLTSRKLNQDEIDSISYILFKRWATSGSMTDKKSDKYQKAQYVQRLILSGTGIGKINFKGDPKARTWEITLKQPDGSWKTATEQEVKDFLKNQYINIDINLSKENIPFTTYRIENGKVVVDKEYKPKKISDTVTLTPYKQFLLDNIKTKGTSATKLQDNFYIEVGDVDNTLAAEITKATEEKAPEPAITEKPVENTEIVKQSPALDEFNDILNEKEKPIDPLAIDDDFTGLLRSRKLSQEATAEQNKKAKEWYENSPLKNFITLNQLQNIVNSDAYASWNWGAISLFKGSQYTDLYHEAWHEFSQLYLTKKQKEALYNEVRNLPQYKGFTNKQIEEVIAEDFRNYALSNGKLILNNRYKRNSIFRKIWNFLKEWVTGKTDLQTVYDRLYTGNVSKYKRNLNNAFWGNLNLGITTQDGKQLSDTDTKNLYRAIDSLVGKIFQQNGKPVTIMFADNKVLSVVYGAIYKNFVNRRNAILKTLQEKAKQNLSEEEKQKLRIEKQTFYNLKDITDNWNTVVQNHKKYSAFFNISKDKISFDEEGNIVSIDDKLTEETDEGNSRESELIKNENVSSKEAASNETIFTIATLPRYNSDGTRAINPFLPFVQDIVDFNSTWDKLTTATNNHLEYSQVLSKIEELGQKDKSFQDLLQRLPNSEKSLTDDEQRMKAAFMNDISKPLVQVYELIMTPVEGKMFFAYKTAASSDLDKIKRQWNDNFEATSPFIKQNPDDSLYLDKEEIKSIYGAKGSKPAFYYNKQDYEKADKKQMFENRIDFLSKIGVTFTEEILSDPEFQDLITKDFVKTVYTNHSSVFTLYELITKSKEDISSLPQLSKVKPSPEFKYFAKAIEELANFELLGSNNLFAQSVKNAEQNSVWQIRQWNYITKVFNALNDVEKYPTYQDLQKEEWLQQFNFEVNPYVKGIYLNTLFDLNPESPTYGQRRVIKKGNKTIYPTISLHDYNGMRLNLADNKTNEGKGTTSLTAFEKIIQNINSLLLFNTQENLRYGDKSSSFSTSISYYINTKTGKLEERKSIIPFGSFINKREAIILPEEAFKYLVADLRQEIIPMIKFEHEQIGSNLKHYNKNIKNFGTFDGILSKETKDAIKKQIITPNIQDPKQIDKILFELPLREEFETYITDKSKQLSDLLDTQGILEDVDIFDSRLIQENIKTPEGKTISQPLPKQSMLYGYIVNSLLYNIEHTKIISFDPRFYKNPKDVIKRLSAWSATGNMFVVDGQTNNYIDNKGNAIKDAVAKKLGIEIPKIFPDGKIRSVISKDNEYSANKLLESYREKFLATGKYTTEQLKTILKAYSKVNEADGQGHITLDLLRQSKLRAGSSHWTKAHENAYQKEAKFLAGESTEGMTTEEAVALFPPQKWQYAGVGLWNGWLPYPVFYKFSVIPLIPSAIKGTTFEKIHDNLVKQNVGLHLFESGSKNSAVLNEENEFNNFYENYETRTPYLGEYTINTVFFQYLKEQVNVEPELKEEVSFSTQMRKLLHLNLYNNGVPNDVNLSSEEWNKLSKTEKLKQSPIYKSEQRFGDVIENLVKIEQESIIKKMGATKQPDGNYKLDAEKLAEFFKEEFIKRDLPNEVVNYLQAFEGEFLFPIDAFKQRATIERIAYSIANKKLVQQKITGEALVQVASTGFEITDKFSSVKEDSDLPFYTEPGKAKKVKIAFTERWKPLLNLEYNGKRIATLDRLNEAIKNEEWLEQNRKSITIVGVRIPVQAPNSMEFMEVFHFLPPTSGNVIVVSPALGAKSGGDFDIDKLTTFFPNLNSKGKTVAKQSDKELKEIYNNIVNKYKKEDKSVDKLISSIFGITEEELQEELIQELIENNEIVSFEQFKNNQNKKAYENELIDIIRETLSRPDNFLQLIRPNDTDLLKNEEYGADKLKELFPKPYQDNTFTSVVDFGSLIEEFKSNLVGKSNLGIAAVNNVLFALAQRAGLHHNEKFTYRNFNGKFETKAVEYYLPHNTVKVGGKELVSLSGLFSKDSNNYISDIISQYINGFVDVAKDDWVFFIGGVREFVPTMLYTALAGTNAKTTIAFFNQPIMREYIKNVDKYKNLFTKLKSPEDYNMGNWKALQDAIYTYIQKDETLSTIYEQESLKEKGLPFIAIRKYINENVSPDFLTEERLSDALYNNNPLTPEQEIFLIFHFWELRRQSGILTNLQRSVNADTKKVGNGYSSIERQTMFDDVLKTNLFNADAMYRMRNESTIKAFTNDKTGFDTFSQQLFTDLFEITNHPTFNKVIRELINNDKELNYEFKFNKLEKLVNTIKNDFITYLYQNQVLDGNDNLFQKTKPLFNPKSSMALELKAIKEKYPNLSTEFPILDLIVPDNYKSGNTILKTNLKLKKRLVDKEELDSAIFQIRQLQTFNSVKYTPEQQIEIQQFTDRLIKFIIVQSGLNPSVYNLLDIIPNEAYTQNIKSIIKDVQKALNKDINTPFALKSDKKSPSQKSLEKFYNRFKVENPAFYKFEPTDEELRLNFINQRGKNYYLPTTDITGTKAKEAEDKLLAYLPTLPAKSKIVDKNNGQTLKQNPKSLFVVYDNKEEVNKKALNQQKITNFATMVAIDKDTIDRQLDEIISKSMNYESISFNLSKGYFQDIKESNPELFNYASQRLKDLFNINNPEFEEVKEFSEISNLEQSEAIDFVWQQTPELKEIFKNNKELYQEYLEFIFPKSSTKGKILYHGTYYDFEGFDKEKLGQTTGLGKYIDKKTGEEIPIDSSFAFFFTDTKLNASAYSYKGRANLINETLYHLSSIAEPLFKSKERIDESIKYLKTIPFFNNLIETAKSEDKPSKEIQAILKEEYIKFYKKTKESSFDRFTNWQVNNYEDIKQIENFKQNVDKFLKGNPDIKNRFGNFENYNSGLGNYFNVWYDKNTKEYEFFNGLTKERFTSKEATKDKLNKFFDDALIEINKSEQERLTEMKSLGYVEKIKPVVINLENPLVHDYEGSAFPDTYKRESREESGKKEVETGYIAARQVAKALKEGYDGVVYENIVDPLESTSYGVFDANNIHTLGSKQDIEKAKQFVKQKETKEIPTQEVVDSGIDTSRKIEVVNRYTNTDVKTNPDKIYVFGDNTQRIGTGGQAQIRNNPNAFGIATKLKPTMNTDAFMSDKDLEANKQIIDSDIQKILDQNKPIVLPKDGFGTGLAKLKEKAPKTYEYLKQQLLDKFGFNNDTGELKPNIVDSSKEITKEDIDKLPDCI